MPPPSRRTSRRGDATVAAFKSELGPPSDLPSLQRRNRSCRRNRPRTGRSENGDPAGPSLDQLIETPAAGKHRPRRKPQPEQSAPRRCSEIAIPAEHRPPIADEPHPSAPARAANVESIAARRRSKRGSARRRIPVRAARMPAHILLLACIVAALIGWRGTIVKHAPQMASLYAAIGMPVNLRGLTFTEVKVSRDIHDGVAVLVVEGTIASTASKPVEVPRLRFAMRNEAGGEVYAWTAMPTREVLEPGETLPFRSRLASPPGEGRDVTVRFFNRLDATAGLR